LSQAAIKTDKLLAQNVDHTMTEIFSNCLGRLDTNKFRTLSRHCPAQLQYLLARLYDAHGA